MTLKRLKRKEPHGQLCLPGTGSRALLLKTKRCSILREREGVSDGGEAGRDGQRMEKGKGDREWGRPRRKEPAVRAERSPARGRPLSRPGPGVVRPRGRPRRAPGSAGPALGFVAAPPAFAPLALGVPRCETGCRPLRAPRPWDLRQAWTSASPKHLSPAVHPQRLASSCLPLASGCDPQRASLLHCGNPRRRPVPPPLIPAPLAPACSPVLSSGHARITRPPRGSSAVAYVLGYLVPSPAHLKQIH